MIEILNQLANGFVECLTPMKMAMLFIGIVIGLLIGVLPGLTLVMGVALNRSWGLYQRYSVVPSPSCSLR